MRPQLEAVTLADTARWVATYRATESARPAALFQDPYAEQLAGARGRAIADSCLPYDGWNLIVRTRLIDDLITAAVTQGCDCVVNMGAGFDTRPYRLGVRDTQWIEVDCADILDAKDQLLASFDVPSQFPSQLHRIRMDLTDARSRKALL